MKKGIKLLTAITIAMSLVGCSTTTTTSDDSGIYTPGTYAESARGFGGDVTVTLTVDANSITEVTVEGPDETETVGGAALEELAEQIKTAQSAEIDGVSGATVTSTAAKEAATKAIAKAKGEEESVATELNLTDGTYTATTTSYAEQYGLATAGEMTMVVTISDNKITAIEVPESTDTDVIGQMAFPILTEEVIRTQSLAVDTVSGATVSSNAYMTALKDCITQAGGSDAVEVLMNVEIAKEDPVETTYDTDILVIGAGMAGLSAAIEAAGQGANVLLVEKNKVYSSSTTRSVGYVIGAGTDVQEASGIEDTPEAFAEDLYSLYKDEETLDADLLEMMALGSGEQISWLEEQGVQFDSVIRKSEKGARSTPRIHTTAGGGYVTSTLVSAAEKAGVTILMGTPATSLIQEEDGSIVGAKATNDNGDDITINAKSTIVCAGSYTNNQELFEELNPRIDNIGYACGSGDGDAYNWFVEAGADIVNVEYTQFMYYAYATTITEFPEVIPNSPDNPVYDILLVGGNSERLTAEDNFCFEFTKENWNLGYNEGYAIVDQEFMDTYPIFYNDMMTCNVPSDGKPFAYSGETAEELAEPLGLDAETLQASIDRYNELCDKGVDEDFGKDSKYMNKLEGTLYIIRLPQITTDGYTGARINENGQVLDTNGNVINGLFAAGSCADGQVTSVNYYGCGTSLLTCATFGRAAADYAVSLLNK